MSLLTRSQFKTLFNIVDTDTSHDAQIDLLLGMVQDEIETYLGFHIDAADYTEYYNGTGNTFLRLKNIPIVSLTSVVFDAQATTTTTVLGTQFVIDSPVGMISFKPNTTLVPGYFACGTQNILATYRGGYESGTIPPQLTMAASMLVKAFMLQADPKAQFNQEKLDQWARARGNLLNLYALQNAAAKMILDRFKVVRYV